MSRHICGGVYIDSSPCAGDGQDGAYKETAETEESMHGRHAYHAFGEDCDSFFSAFRVGSGAIVSLRCVASFSGGRLGSKSQDVEAGASPRGAKRDGLRVRLENP